MNNTAADIFSIILGALFVLGSKPMGEYLSNLAYGNNSKARVNTITNLIVGVAFICFGVYGLLSR